MTPRPQLRIRVATAEDMPAMVDIVNAAFAIETFLDGERINKKQMGEMMQNGQFLVGQDESDRIVACVYIESHGERGYFGMLAIEPSQQGNGLGRQMVEAVEKHCHERGCLWMDMNILSLRPELLPFYRHLGYAESGTEEFRASRRLKHGFECHRIIMSKALREASSSAKTQ
jgi:GNAT superfamily N-acetyltransferase